MPIHSLHETIEYIACPMRSRIFVSNAELWFLWTTQQASNFLDDKNDTPEKAKMKYLIHDGGTQFDHKWNKDFLTILKSEGVKLCKVNHLQLNYSSERVIQTI